MTRTTDGPTRVAAPSPEPGPGTSAGTLRVEPCVPSGWSGYEVTYRYRSATYRIRLENADGTGHGVRSVTADSQTVEGGAVPLRDDGREQDVRVTLG
jgi:cellobiose phosphorylase